MFDCNLRMRKVEVPGKTFTKLEVEITRICPVSSLEGYPELKPFDLAAIYAPMPIGTLRRKIPGLRRALAAQGVSAEGDPNAMDRDGLMAPMDVDPGDGEGAPMPDDLDGNPEAVDRDELPDFPSSGAPPMADALKKGSAAKAGSKPTSQEGDLGSTDDSEMDLPPTLG